MQHGFLHQVAGVEAAARRGRQPPVRPAPQARAGSAAAALRRPGDRRRAPDDELDRRLVADEGVVGGRRLGRRPCEARSSGVTRSNHKPCSAAGAQRQQSSAGGFCCINGRPGVDRTPAHAHARPDRQPLSHHRQARHRRHGRRVRGRGHAAAAQGRAEVPARANWPTTPTRCAASRREAADHRAAEPSQHLHDLRHGHPRRPPVHRDGAARRREPEDLHGARGPRASDGCSTSRGRSPRRSAPRTPRASSTATSSRAT